MDMRVSADGLVMLPGALRERLRISAGDFLSVTIEGEGADEHIVLKPQEPAKKYELNMITDPRTGWPVLTAGPGAPELTSEQVAELLVDFP